jgi:hypothetical protein
LYTARIEYCVPGAFARSEYTIEADPFTTFAVPMDAPLISKRTVPPFTTPAGLVTQAAIVIFWLRCIAVIV